MKSPEEYEKEIAALKSELERLNSRLCLNLAGGQTIATPGESFTIVGLPEMVLLVDEQGVVIFANSAMAHLLGAQDKSQLLKTPLTNWDNGPLGEGFFNMLLETVKSTEQTCVLEREFPEFPDDILPEKTALKCAVTLRFVAAPVKDRVQLVIQDVTRSRWLEKTFSKYVSPKVIDMLGQVPATELLKVERRVLSVLFADLRGFTRVSQEIEPEAVCEMVNSFLERMVTCIEDYDGTVDKFAGDEVMAVFGAPLKQNDHSLRALLSAAEMIRSHQQWQELRLKKNQPAPPVGIGIASGEVIVGNIGTEKQMDYTVLGHSVNLAARLCGAAEGMEILTVKETYKAALEIFKQGIEFKNIPHLHFEPKGKIELKNVKVPVDIIRVIPKFD